MNRDLRPGDSAIEREQLEWLAQISTTHERQLQELKSAEAEARREAQQLEWAARVCPGCQARQSSPLRSAFEAEVREFADTITGRSTVEIGEAWDPAKHPRTLAPPNPGWWARTGGFGAGTNSGADAFLVSSSWGVRHHWAPVGVVLDDEIRPLLSDEAVEYAMGSYSGKTDPFHRNGTYAQVTHPQYNVEVKKEIKAFMAQRKITKMTAAQMEEFVGLMEKGLDASGEPHRFIGPFNKVIKGMVPEGTAVPSKMEDILAAGRKYLKHPRFQILAAGAVISGVLGEAVAQQVKILELAKASGHYKRAIQALRDGDLAKAHGLLTDDDGSLYAEILTKVGYHAATNFRTKMDRAFTNAQNRLYK